MLKLFKILILVFISTVVFAQERFTPEYIQMMQKYYEANNENKNMVAFALILHNRHKVGLEDYKEGVVQLALYMAVSPDKKDAIAEKTTCPIVQAFYGGLLISNGDREKGTEYIKKSVNQNYMGGYYAAIANNIKGGCSIAKEGYEKFGLPLFLPFFLDNEPMLKSLVKCGVFDTDNINSATLNIDILNGIGTDESKFFLAAIENAHGDRNKSIKMFEELLNSDNNRVVANAEFCLGSIYMETNKKKSDNYLKSSMDKGQYKAGVWLYPFDNMQYPKPLIWTDYNVGCK